MPVVARSRSGHALLGLVLLKLALHLSTIGLYGYHRDELYLLACAKRLAWGSPDHAPLTPAVSRLLEVFFGASAPTQRLVSVVAGALVVGLTGLCARALGGGVAAEIVAAGAIFIAPMFVFASGVQSTNALDQLAWVLASYLLLQISTADQASTRRVRCSWLALGLIVGVGLLNKYTMLLWVLGALAGLIATPARRHLRTPWAWAAAAITLAIVLPNLAWQFGHGFPAVAFLAEHHSAVRKNVAMASSIIDQVRLIHPISFAVALLGIRAAFQPAAASSIRPFAIALLVILTVVLLAPGKAYYVAPAYPIIIAAGAVDAAERLRRSTVRLRAAIAATCVVTGAIGIVGTLPLLPPWLAQRLRMNRFNRELVQFADWREVASQIAGTYHGVIASPSGGILTDSYGTAAALELFGPELHLPSVSSGANCYFAWGPAGEPDELVALGYAPDLLTTFYEDVTPVGEVRSPSNLDNRFDFPRTIYRCRAKRSRLRDHWALLRRFD